MNLFGFLLALYFVYLLKIILIKNMDLIDFEEPTISFGQALKQNVMTYNI